MRVHSAKRRREQNCCKVSYIRCGDNEKYQVLNESLIISEYSMLNIVIIKFNLAISSNNGQIELLFGELHDTI